MMNPTIKEKVLEVRLISDELMLENNRPILFNITGQSHPYQKGLMSREDYLNYYRSMTKQLIPEIIPNIDCVMNNLWRHAEVYVEDIIGGICITLLLPNMSSIIFELAKKKKKIKFESHRHKVKGEHHTNINCLCTIFQFHLSGIDYFGEDMLSYEYFSDSGLLHIFINKVHLYPTAIYNDIPKDHRYQYVIIKEHLDKIFSISE